MGLILAPQAGLAYNSGICTGAFCKESEVGAFMKGITKECGNLGNCELKDIMIVFTNVGNFILGIVGGLVLLMYVIGGIYMLASGGNSARVDKGKKFIKISTTGLLIILFAYLGITFISSSLTGGTPGTTQIVDCSLESDGVDCGVNSQCFSGVCKTKCSIGGPNRACVPKEQAQKKNYTMISGHNLCPGSQDPNDPKQSICVQIK